MGYPTKVQVIRRQASEQWYINFPAAIAQAMEFTKGETVEWIVQDRRRLLLRRRQAAPLEATEGKKKRRASSRT
jgi:antitoxin component of MazEF toxin-antitoxin module